MTVNEKYYTPREMWKAKCHITGEEFVFGRINDLFECRNPKRFTCPNFTPYMNSYNCILLKPPCIRYDRYCLPSRLNSEVERLKGRDTEGLANMFFKTEKEYLDTEVSEKKTQLRAVLGAIIVILRERKEQKAIFKNLI